MNPTPIRHAGRVSLAPEGGARQSSITPRSGSNCLVSTTQSRPTPGRSTGSSATGSAVHDAASHHLASLGSLSGASVVPVGVDEFGQSGTIANLYRTFDLTSDQIVSAALVATA